MSLKIGLIGARGHVGSELIRLVSSHPEFELGFVASRGREGKPLSDFESGAPDLRYINPGAVEAAALGADALLLALPNGMAAEFAAAVDAVSPATVVLDLSADYRFDHVWYYGLPELTRAKAAGATRISNPGCYATAMQLALAPLRGRQAAPAQCFGVSGYSGAGTIPSDKNDPAKLHDNLIPYSLVDHIHEREVARQLGEPVEFVPAVAPHFRGITMTVNAHLSEAMSRQQVIDLFEAQYRNEPLVEVLEHAPWVSQIAGRHGVQIGGFTLSADGRRLVLVSTLDNLLKGAATQAVQNLNLAFGFEETLGIPL